MWAGTVALLVIIIVDRNIRNTYLLFSLSSAVALFASALKFLNAVDL